MKLHKKHMVLVCFILLLMSVILFGFAVRQQTVQEAAGDSIYLKARDVLMNFPDLQEKYGYAKIYLYDGTSEYMIVKTKNMQVAGVRCPGAEAIYYFNGNKYCIESDNELLVIGKEDEPVTIYAAKFIEALLTDSTVAYSFHDAHSLNLPLWVYPDERYIQCTRKDYENCMETIVCDQGKHGEYIRWSIVDGQEQPLLFLFLSETVPADYESEDLTGWGELNDIINIFADQT